MRRGCLASLGLVCSLGLGACAETRGEAGYDPLPGDGGDPGGDDPTSSTADTGSSDGGDGNDGGEGSTGDTGDDPTGGTGGDGDIRFDVGSNTGTGGGPGDGAGGEGCKFIDVLFLVDISGSMSEEKANLAANFPSFVQVLDEYVENSEATGYRLGVTNSSINGSYGSCSTTMGLDGELFGGSAFSGDCGTGGELWLDGPAAGIADNFSCLGENPIPGNGGSDCGRERPLDTVEYFIEKSAPGQVNEGFYRDDESLLVLVTLTDEDDDAEASTTTPAQTKSALDAFAGGEERYVIVTIAGPGPGPCSSDFGEAEEAMILREFTDSVPNGMFGDICQGDLAMPLQQALELIQISCDSLPPPVG